MALAAWSLGGLALIAPRIYRAGARAAARAGDLFGPRRWYGLALRALNVVSDRLHDAEVRDLRNSIAAVLVPTALLLALGFAVTPTRDAYEVGSMSGEDLPVVVLLGLAVVAALSVARDQGRLRPVLALSVLGFALAAAYAVTGAPDVALVAVLVETVLTLVFVAVFSRLPPESVGAATKWPKSRRRRNVIVGVLAGAGAFATIWAALSRPAAATRDMAEHIRRTPEAHGGDVVTVILADFRGLDTLVEITVLAVAVAGAATLLGRLRA